MVHMSVCVQTLCAVVALFAVAAHAAVCPAVPFTAPVSTPVLPNRCSRRAGILFGQELHGDGLLYKQSFPFQSGSLFVPFTSPATVTTPVGGVIQVTYDDTVGSTDDISLIGTASVVLVPGAVIQALAPGGIDSLQIEYSTDSPNCADPSYTETLTTPAATNAVLTLACVPSNNEVVTFTIIRITVIPTSPLNQPSWTTLFSTAAPSPNPNPPSINQSLVERKF